MAQLTRYGSPQAFYEAIAPSLLQHEAQNNLMIGLAWRLAQQKPAVAQTMPYAAAVHVEGDLRVVAFLPSGRNLLLAVSDTKPMDADLHLLADDMGHAGLTLPGIHGVTDAVDRFISLWTQVSGQHLRFDMRQCIYQLERVKPVTGVSSHMIRAAQKHYDLLVRWMTSFTLEAIPSDGTAGVPDVVTRRISHDDSALYLWCDPEPVSMAGVSGPTPNGIRVNAVYTPPELRRRGYASAVTAALSQLILDQGRQYCFLFTDGDNPTSNHIYQNIGYEWVCDVNLYKSAPASGAGTQKG